MSDDLVKRYQLDYHHARTYAEMAEDCDGDWVKYNDYKDAADHIAELEAELAKVIDFVAEVGGGFKFGESLVDWANLHVLKARTLLAELSKERSDEKGETDE